MAATALIMTLVFGAPTFAAMTPTLWALFALGQVSNIPSYIKTEKQLIAFINSPAFRQMAARNGEAAIQWQQKQMEY